MARKHDRRRPARRPHRLSLEPLESRTLLSFVELTALGDRGITITKTGIYEEYSKQPAVGVEDVNGDGYGDFLLNFRPRSGSGGEILPSQAFLFYGRPAFPAVLDVTTWEPDVTLSGPSALSVAAAGDVNGDGLADLLIGAHDATVDERAHAGLVFLVFGSRTLLPAIDLLDLGPAGVVFSESLSDNVYSRWTGYLVDGVGDVNNDGYDDVLIALYASWYLSRAYLVYGSAILPEAMDLTVPQSGVRTIVMQPQPNRCSQPGYWIGSLDGAGDVNGDGFDDVLLGTEFSDLCGSEAYLLYGAPSLPATIELNASFPLGARLHPDGHNTDLYAAGDVDRDGYADILVGSSDFAIWHGGCGSHLSVLVYGSPSLPNEVFLDYASCRAPDPNEVGTRVSVLPNGGPESSGSVNGAGDTNGDGFADILLSITTSGGSRHVAVIPGGDDLPSHIVRSAAFDPDGPSLILRGTPGDGTGAWVGPAGDINGDRLADYFISASFFGIPDAPPFGRLYLVFGRDSQGPRVESATPSGPLVAGSRGVRHVDLSFSEAIDPLTFTTDDITLVGPAGPIPIRRIRQISDTEFRIRFPQQTTIGEYHLTLGPDVTDLAGNRMDEPFASSFRIVRRTFVFFFTGKDAPAEGSGMEKLRGAIARDPVLSKLHVLAPVFGWTEGTRPKTQRLAAQAFVQSFLTSRDADRVHDRVVLVGHSYGGNIAYLISGDLDGRGPKTQAAYALLTFDPIDWRLCTLVGPAVDCNQSNNPRPLPRNVTGNHIINFLQRRRPLRGFPIETARNDDQTGQGPDGRWGTPLDPSPDDTTHALIDNDWSPGADGKPGFANVDDDGNGKTDDDTEVGFPGSDDAALGTHAIALDFLLELANQ